MGLKSDQLQIAFSVDAERTERAREKKRQGIELSWLEEWLTRGDPDE